ncbi:hypothetical protein PSQ90_04920 [Devosia rhodophyticola]|uniref:DUF2946 domain-containing protein n=1 Tax=Devosia rhodophyticola TaxID=3026423 RepID=A0ABY7YZX1_9HYPH|nr:hypothetical protein [Devosia rhodophyticola]WDR06797.1 hypothetical protein PSQ90_04920 [Devosia rhodophyticola]
MRISAHRIVKEVGTALAVLAIYLLIVLMPMHQSRASQLELDALGYATLAPSWALCGAPDKNDGTDTRLTKCPIAGVAKQSMATDNAPVLSLGSNIAVLPVIYRSVPGPFRPTIPDHDAPARGPPDSA